MLLAAHIMVSHDWQPAVIETETNNYNNIREDIEDENIDSYILG